MKTFSEYINEMREKVELQRAGDDDITVVLLWNNFARVHQLKIWNGPHDADLEDGVRNSRFARLTADLKQSEEMFKEASKLIKKIDEPSEIEIKIEALVRKKFK